MGSFEETQDEKRGPGPFEGPESQRQTLNMELPKVKTVENPENRMIQTVFLPAKLEDNPLLEERDPEYRQRLYQSGETLARALLEGDWSVFAGQFLTEFSYDKHTCDPREIPRSWIRFRGYDWGYAAPACMAWFAVDPTTGRLYIYNEYYKKRVTDPHQAEEINEMCQPWERFIFNFADPSCWTKRTTEELPKSTFDIFLEHQIYLTKADNNQERKARKLHAALADIHDGEPGLVIFKSCENILEEFQGLMGDPDRPEIPLPKQQDHAYDAVCYGLSNYTPPAITRINKKKQKYNHPLMNTDWT